MFCFQFSVFFLNNKKNFKTKLFEEYFQNDGAFNKENPATWKKFNFHLIKCPPILKNIHLKHDKTQT